MNKLSLARLAEKLKSKKLIAGLLILGALLLLLAPSGGKKEEAKTPEEAPEFSLEAEERRLATILSKIEGAGRVSVMLTVSGGVFREIAENTEETSAEGKRESSKKAVTVQTGGSAQEAVTLRYLYPEYTGALVVADGAGSAGVRLRLTEAVAAVTGLKTDKISVIKMK